MGSPLYRNTLPYITPVWGASPLFCLPHSVVGSLCIGMFQGYQYVMWAFPFCQEGFEGVSPISWGVGASVLEMSICSSFPDRVSSKLGSAWHGSTTTLDAERLWRCYWLSFCATAAASIFNASFSLCQLCYGFSTGRFLFQSWASHHLYLVYVWCPFWCLLFPFRCQVGCRIHLWGLNH